MTFLPQANSFLLKTAAYGILSAVLLSLSFHYPSLYWLPWFALIPFLHAVVSGSAKHAYVTGLLFGMILFGATTFWVVDFLGQIDIKSRALCWLLGLLYWFYSAHVFVAVALAVNWGSRRVRGSEWIVFPLAGTLLDFIFPKIFPTDLAVTQTNFVLVLQGIDVTGAHGLHFIILLCNGLCFHWLRYRKFVTFSGLAALFILTAWIAYGIWSLQHWQTITQNAETLRVGLVQPNLPASIEVPRPSDGYLRAYPPEMELSEQLAAMGATLVVWPESRYVGFHDLPHVREAFTDFVQHHQVALWIQDLEAVDGMTYNTSRLLSVDGQQHTYRKQELIPFGEYLPFAAFPLVQAWLKPLFGSFYTPLTKGEISPPMAHQDFIIQPLICYEISRPIYVSRLLKNTQQNVQMLLIQSNNSWFGSSIQPRLHAYTGILRSVEQRKTSLHAMNNGPSMVIVPSGDIVFESPRQYRSGYVINVPLVDAVPTLFNLYPYGFILLLTSLAIISVLILTNVIRLKSVENTFP